MKDTDTNKRLREFWVDLESMDIIEEVIPGRPLECSFTLTDTLVREVSESYDAAVEGMRTALASCYGLLDFDCQKTVSESGEVKYWISAEDVRFICSEALEAYDLAKRQGKGEE